jgi:hypothetical protein
MMARDYPDCAAWREETTAIEKSTTMDPKQDAVQTEAAMSELDPEMNHVASPFEEKTDEERKLVRKIDWYLMPTIWVLYCFSYMVRRTTPDHSLRRLNGLGSHRHWQRESRWHGQGP